MFFFTKKLWNIILNDLIKIIKFGNLFTFHHQKALPDMVAPFMLLERDNKNTPTFGSSRKPWGIDFYMTSPTFSCEATLCRGSLPIDAANLYINYNQYNFSSKNFLLYFVPPLYFENNHGIIIAEKSIARRNLNAKKNFSACWNNYKCRMHFFFLHKDNPLFGGSPQ